MRILTAAIFVMIAAPAMAEVNVINCDMLDGNHVLIEIDTSKKLMTPVDGKGGRAASMPYKVDANAYWLVIDGEQSMLNRKTGSFQDGSGEMWRCTGKL